MKTYRFGKHPKKQDDRNLMFAKYATTLTTPPDSSNNLEKIYSNLRISDISKLFPMDGNDTLGDCVMAGSAHIITSWRALVNKKKIPAKCTVIRQYKKLTGGADTGLNELDTLNYWRQHSFFDEEIKAHVEIDPKNQTHIMQGIDLFGGLFIGMGVQENTISDFNNGITWTPGPMIPNEGHCVILIDYNKDFITVLTWGGKILATWDWVYACVDEIHCILPPEFDSPELEADLAEVTK